MTFAAKYRGPCANDDCDAEVLPGQEVEWTLDRHVMHVICPNETDSFGTPLQVCPRCFTAIPVAGVCGVCDDD